MKRQFQLLSIALLIANTYSSLFAQGDNALSRATHNVTYNAEVQGSFSNNDTPLWLTANRYGLSSIKQNNGYARASIFHNTTADSAHQWRIGYGADLVAPISYSDRKSVV